MMEIPELTIPILHTYSKQNNTTMHGMLTLCYTSIIGSQGTCNKCPITFLSRVMGCPLQVQR